MSSKGRVVECKMAERGGGKQKVLSMSKESKHIIQKLLEEWSEWRGQGLIVGLFYASSEYLEAK
jgi:hypothetical protein